MNKKATLLSVIVIVVLLLSSQTSLNSIARNSPELDYASYSPKGKNGGAAVPASCESGYSHAGECFTLDGQPVPPDTPFPPTPQCPCDSAENSCGMTNPGFGACGGSCPVPSPSDDFCPATLINIKTGNNVGGGGGVSVTIGKEQTVNRGESCTISWDASPATSCTVTGPGLSVSGVSGTVKTPPITATSIYTIKCFNGKTVSSSRNFTCRLNPDYKEVQ
jgi:hypothetical protein